MPLVASMLVLAAEPTTPPPCRRDQLTIGVGPREGVADFAPVSGMIVSVRNHGPDCAVRALPSVALRDGRGRRLAATRRVPPGLHPGPVVVPLVISGGHRATFELTWPYCPTNGRCVRVRSVTVSFEPFSLQAPVAASIGTAPAGTFRFDQPPGRVTEGMASDLD